SDVESRRITPKTAKGRQRPPKGAKGRQLAALEKRLEIPAVGQRPPTPPTEPPTPLGSLQNCFDHVAVAEGQRAAEAVADLRARIDTQQVVDGRGEVRRRGRVGGRLRGEFVAGAINYAALHPAAGQDGCEHLAPVVAAVAARTRAAGHRLTHLRRPAHL